MRLPRATLEVSEPGVYWFGIHALGEGPEPRDATADGRARTFLPLVPTTRRSVDTALVVPIRRGISHAPDGSVAGLAGWLRTLSADGRLRSLVDFGTAAGSRPITWLVDPAVPDTVRALTTGNPPRSVAPSGETPGQPSPDPTADPDGLEDPITPLAAEELLEEAGLAARAWLNRLQEGLDGSEILALPYGDLDVASAAELGRSLYPQARDRSGNQLAPWGLSMSPAVAPPLGWLSPEALELVGGRATVLLTDRAFDEQPPPLARLGRARVLATSSGAASGGPGPDDQLAPVAFRQRIISEAAVRLLSDPRQPLVVLLPRRFSPSASTGFFEGLDLDWLNLTTVSDLEDRRGRRVDPDTITYPTSEARREIAATNFAATTSLIRAGETLQHVLTENDTVAADVADEARDAVSYASRRHPEAARTAADRARTWIEDQLGSVTIEAPPSVTLSGIKGRFAATITNELDQPLTVSIEALTDSTLTISGPDTVAVGPGGRTTVLLNASTAELGVHNVTLVVTDASGTPLGSSYTVPVRSAQVSKVIWVIIGSGVALLFGAIGVRLQRRLHRAGKAAGA